MGSGTTQGAAYVFVMPTTGPWVSTTQTAELTASDGQSGDELGYSVAISGNTIVAGAPSRQVGGNDGQGAAYEYTEPSSGWTTTGAFTSELTASDGDTVDNLGDSVAVSGTTDRRRRASTRRGVEHRRLRRGVRVRAGDRRFRRRSSFRRRSWFQQLIRPSRSDRSRVVTARSPRRFTVRAGGLACATATLKATVKEHLKGRKITAITAGTNRKARPRRRRQVVVASGDVTLSAGAKKTLTLKLNATGRALLSKFGKLKVVVTVSSGGKTIKTVTVTVLKAEKPRKKKTKKK